MSFFRPLLLVSGFLMTLVVVWLNAAVHRAPGQGSAAERTALMAQLRYLQGRVHNGLDAQMQALFPEGAVFTQALYGLVWCGLAQQVPPSDPTRSIALTEARWALAELDRTSVQAQFATTGALPFGVFYTGWRNLLIGSICMIDTGDIGLRARWDEESSALANAFAANASPYLSSYPGQAWPADATVAVASLALHQGLRAGAHQHVIERWVAQVRERLDANGAMPHAWDPYRDRIHQPARGSSQALMNALLPSIDSKLAREQFALFRTLFFMERFGVPAVSEYPRGSFGWGDFDSGPLIFGAGPAATIVSSAACRMNGDVFHAQEFAASVHGFGFVSGGDQQRYILGAMPIADLFIAWGRSMPVEGEATSYPRFLRFHAWSALVLLLIWAPWWWRLLRRSLRQ